MSFSEIGAMFPATIKDHTMTRWDKLFSPFINIRENVYIILI